VAQPTSEITIISMSTQAPPPPPLPAPSSPPAAATMASNSTTRDNTATIANSVTRFEGAASSSAKVPLFLSYPINSYMELTLAPHREVVRGVIYTTDEISNSIVLRKNLPHTTLSSEIRVVNAASVLEKKTIPTPAGGIKSKNKDVVGSTTTMTTAAVAAKGASSFFDGDSTNSKTDAGATASSGSNDVFDSVNDDAALPLPSVSKKALEERERRAIRLAEEGLRHINQKASPEGQAVFHRLVKACNEVVWRGESIIVLNQIRVDPPYGKEDCKLISGGGGLNEGSLDRVKMIVAAAVSERPNDL